jgi:hypothetical protein
MDRKHSFNVSVPKHNYEVKRPYWPSVDTIHSAAKAEALAKLLIAKGVLTEAELETEEAVAYLKLKGDVDE